MTKAVKSDYISDAQLKILYKRDLDGWKEEDSFRAWIFLEISLYLILGNIKYEEITQQELNVVRLYFKDL